MCGAPNACYKFKPLQIHLGIEHDSFGRNYLHQSARCIIDTVSSILDLFNGVLPRSSASLYSKAELFDAGAAHCRH